MSVLFAFTPYTLARGSAAFFYLFISLNQVKMRFNSSFIADAAEWNFGNHSRLGFELPTPQSSSATRWIYEVTGAVMAVLLSLAVVIVLVRRNIEECHRCWCAFKRSFCSANSTTWYVDTPSSAQPSHESGAQSAAAPEALEMETYNQGHIQATYHQGRLFSISNLSPEFNENSI